MSRSTAEGLKNAAHELRNSPSAKVRARAARVLGIAATESNGRALVAPFVAALIVSLEDDSQEVRTDATVALCACLELDGRSDPLRVIDNVEGIVNASNDKTMIRTRRSLEWLEAHHAALYQPRDQQLGWSDQGPENDQ